MNTYGEMPQKDTAPKSIEDWREAPVNVAQVAGTYSCFSVMLGSIRIA